MIRGGLALLVKLAIAFTIGVNTGDTKTEYRVLHDTETVTKTVEGPVAAPPPAACSEVARLGAVVARAGSAYEKHTAELYDILSDIRIAAAMSDANEANVIETRLRQLDPQTIQAANTLAESKGPLQKAIRECKKGTHQ
jgi:hypothetical protein